MDLPQLRCFLAVAEELHFGKAAMRLHLTPSPVSRMIKSLERELGGELFVRRYHDVQLTALGEALVGPVRMVVRDADRLVNVAAGFVAAARFVRAGASHLIPPMLIEKYTHIIESSITPARLDLTFGASSVLVPDVVDGALDLALVHLPVANDALGVFSIARYASVVVVRSDDELAGRESITLDELKSRTFITGPVSPQPLAVGGMLQRLAEGGITRVHQLSTVDNVQLAAQLRRMGGFTISTRPELGGYASVFLHPSFSMVRLSDESLNLEVGVTWNRERATESELVSTAVHALRDRSREIASEL
ncbi:LysR family transcriptional regulator [Rhodococcus sp. T2V]|uniref:LysR family transcriptional regulator n=1 Tax=Rhodococcus sp. T2V TaxID=3034164 RepID=UPI0023E2AB7F|nr:LysR family transcriptional regulator [Rhodococcus sp. T2V]MDF3312137.1 LysR family transcriptional regulator [Rhodococcus sp. T2V]